MLERDAWASRIEEHVDEAGRAFHFIRVAHPGATDLVVHFSAFFGDWGNARPYRETFKGYFHRLRMLADCTDHNWLFVCDEFGADGNGTYYLGGGGDLYVERATSHILERVMSDLNVGPERMVTMGSSMGATGALDFGLRLGVRGIVAISPHIDLDVCAQRQNRWRHVAFVCPDGDPISPNNHGLTRRIRSMVEVWSAAVPPPRLFMQSCDDDVGVHNEQVMPLVDAWRQAGGDVDLDIRPRGGHTSDWATKPLLLDVTARQMSGATINVADYTKPPFLGRITPTPITHRLKRAGVRVRRRLLPERTPG